MRTNTMFRPWDLLKTLLLSYGLTVVLLLGFSFLMYRMRLSAAQAAWGVDVIYLLACGLGGFLTGKRAENRRLIWGLASGVLYFVVLLFLSWIADGGIQGGFREILTVFGVCLAGSAVGAFVS